MSGYPPWVNVALYQCVWFAAVLGRGDGLVASALTLVPIVAHLVLARERARELAVVIPCAALGVAVDSALVLGGVFVFEPRPPVLPVPWWLIAIWIAFAATLRHALAPLLSRGPLFVALGTVGGPLSYLAAARLGAVELPYGPLASALVLAPAWALVCAALIVSTRRADRAVNRDRDGA